MVRQYRRVALAMKHCPQCGFRKSHVVAGLHLRDINAHGLDDPGAFMAEHDRQWINDDPGSLRDRCGEAAGLDPHQRRRARVPPSPACRCHRLLTLSIPPPEFHGRSPEHQAARWKTIQVIAARMRPPATGKSRSPAVHVHRPSLGSSHDTGGSTRPSRACNRNGDKARGRKTGVVARCQSKRGCMAISNQEATWPAHTA